MIHPQEHKELQHNISTEKFLNPRRLYLHLSQHTGKPAEACVVKGAQIEEADVVAKAPALVSAPVHSPCKGRVSAVENYYHPSLKLSMAIAVDCVESLEKQYAVHSNAAGLSVEEIRETIKNSGIVGMGGAAFPTHVKLNPPAQIDTVIINGCECEPYLACDYRLIKENLDEILKGVEIICRLVNPKRVIIALEENKHEAVKKLNQAITIKKYKIPEQTVAVLKTAYPQGGEKQLIAAVTGRKVPGGKLPFDAGCLVHNVATCFAIYDAVYRSKPLIERLVTFAGDALVAPKNVWVKIGTPLRELFERKVLEFKNEPAAIICGGPMMGTALDNLDYPVLKGTGGFLFMSSASGCSESACIRCARCVDVCPMELLPMEYARRVKKGVYGSLEDFNIGDCIECGCCAYVCPARIPIVHYIKTGKRYMPKKTKI